ncbi:putative ribonuclease H-like domain-containing protein, partial [Tanacetum coccineum]
SPFDLVAYTDSDYAGASLDRKSTTGGCQILTKIHIDNESTICIVKNPVFHSKTKHIEIRHHFIRDSNKKKLIQMIKIHIDYNFTDFLTKAFDKVIITEMSVRRDLQLEDVEGIECLPNDAIFEQLALMGFVQVFLDKQVEGMSKHKGIYVTHSHTKKVFTNMKRQGKDFSGRVTPLFPTMMVQDQEDMGEVLDLENTKPSQAAEKTKLKERVKKLEKKGGSRTHKLKRLYKVGRSARVISSEDEGEEVFAGQSEVEKEVSAADQVTTASEVVTTASVDVSTAIPTETTTVDELNLAQTLIEIERAKPKVKKVVVQEPVESTTTTEPLTIPKAKSITFREPGESTTRTTPTPIPSNIKDKGKAKMIEPEKPLKMKEQIRLDEELALKLQAEEQEEDRLAREKSQQVEDANIAEWDGVQAMMDAYYELAAGLQAEEQGELTIEERLKLFVELMDKRKKHFARLRAEERRRKPPTKAQKRNQMCTYLKNMVGFTHNQLKKKSFDEVQKAFDKTMSWIDSFVPIYSKVVKGSKDRAEGSETRAEGSSKRAREDL